MRSFTAPELVALAAAYRAATGVGISTLCRTIFQNRNDKVFTRLADGDGISLKSALKVSEWFVANWPADVPWPENVPSATECEQDAAQ